MTRRLAIHCAGAMHWPALAVLAPSTLLPSVEAMADTPQAVGVLVDEPCDIEVIDEAVAARSAILPVDATDVLSRVLALPMSTWSYIAQGEAIRHVGPMAQDFRAAFGLGENDTTIATVDADGVALAAIQGLNAKLEAQNAALLARIAALEAALVERERE